MILLQLGVLALSTSFVFVDPGEKVLLERFGRPAGDRAVLGPGAHFKLPWPVDKTYRYATDRIQTIYVGFTPDENWDAHRTILWTVEHAKEDNFLVASRETSSGEGPGGKEVRKVPPVNLLTVNIPVEFQIRDVVAWAYNNQDARGLLQHIAGREVVRYLVSVDLGEIMSHGRLGATEALRHRIQQAADSHRLGADILFVGLQGIHPPLKVAADYEKVVAAIHQKEAIILAARAEAIRTNALAGAQVFTITNDEETAGLRIETLAFARASVFTNQLLAYNAAPSVYPWRVYSQVFPRATAHAGKYVLLATNTDNVLVFDLQKKLGEDLMNLTVGAPPANK